MQLQEDVARENPRLVPDCGCVGCAAECHCDDRENLYKERTSGGAAGSCPLEQFRECTLNLHLRHSLQASALGRIVH